MALGEFRGVCATQPVPEESAGEAVDSAQRQASRPTISPLKELTFGPDGTNFLSRAWPSAIVQWTTSCLLGTLRQGTVAAAQSSRSPQRDVFQRVCCGARKGLVMTFLATTSGEVRLPGVATNSVLPNGASDGAHHSPHLHQRLTLKGA